MVETETKIQRYESYKDSGVEWLGDIPEHWEVIKLKFLSEIKTGEKDTVDRNDDGQYPFFIRSKNVQRIHTYSYDEEAVLTAGDGDIGKIFHYINGKFEYHQRVYKFSGFRKIIAKCLYYYLHYNLAEEVVKLSAKTTVDSLRLPMLQNFFVAVPPLPEQTAISQFLDDKTTKIDQAIAIKQQQIALLKERKQILIHKAVTRGLNPNVKLKDSGVEWIGEIPEHWEVLPGFMVYKENKTKNEGMKEDVVLSLSYGNIIVKPEEKLVGLVPESFETYQIVKPGDIIIRCMDLQNDKTSLRTGIANNDGIITSAYLNLNIINNNVSEYVYNFLHALDVTKVLYKFGTGLRQNLSFTDFKHLRIPIPPTKEQNEIVIYINEITNKIETAISLQEQEISKLQEYKSSLINSVVTGKVRVF